MARAEQLARLLSHEIRFRKGFCRNLADIACGDHRKRHIGADWARHGSERLNDAYLWEQVLHEVAATEREDVQSVNRIEFLFQAVQTEDGPGAIRLVGTSAAHDDSVSDPVVANRRGQLVTHAVLVASTIGR